MPRPASCSTGILPVCITAILAVLFFLCLLPWRRTIVATLERETLREQQVARPTTLLSLSTLYPPLFSSLAAQPRLVGGMVSGEAQQSRWPWSVKPVPRPDAQHLAVLYHDSLDGGLASPPYESGCVWHGRCRPFSLRKTKDLRPWGGQKLRPGHAL